jgi:ParB family chromosome partitioning protein
LQKGVLSEGHGRALLLAEDHGARRSLARSAAAEGWSVRLTEARAREQNAGGRGKRGRDERGAGAARRPHPDQEHGAKQIADALANTFGADVRVKPTRDGGYRAELSFATLEEAIALARRLSPQPPLESAPAGD